MRESRLVNATEEQARQGGAWENRDRDRVETKSMRLLLGRVRNQVAKVREQAETAENLQVNNGAGAEARQPRKQELESQQWHTA